MISWQGTESYFLIATAAVPVCIPARRSLMTGTFPKTHGDRVYSDRMLMPDACTLAEAFSKAGYQTMAVGKLHVYPQRSRIGFDEVILQEEGRYEFGVTDDYQIWLGEHGMTAASSCTAWGTTPIIPGRGRCRREHIPPPGQPPRWYARSREGILCGPSSSTCPISFPHPPLVPLQAYLDMYREDEMPAALT